MTLNNYGDPDLQLAAYDGTVVLTQFAVSIANAV